MTRFKHLKVFFDVSNVRIVIDAIVPSLCSLPGFRYSSFWLLGDQSITKELIKINNKNNLDKDGICDGCLSRMLS